MAGVGGIMNLALLGIALISLVSGLPEGDARDHILKGLDFAYSEEYANAEREFEKVVELDKENPSGYLFQTGLLHLYMNDFTTYEAEDEFYSRVEETVERARALIAESPQDAWGYFCLGGAYSYLTFHYAQQKKYWWAVQYGIRAVRELEKSLALAPDLYDAYLGIGSYHYFQNEAKEKLPFLEGNKEKGIEEIRLAVEKGIYLRVPAKDGLSLVLLREGRYEEALRLAKELVDEYPASRTFLWTLCKVYFEKGDWENAEESFRALLARLEDSEPNNLYNVLFCRMRIAETYYERGMHTEAEREAGRILELAAQRGSGKDLGELVGEAEKLLKTISKKKGGEG